MLDSMQEQIAREIETLQKRDEFMREKDKDAKKLRQTNEAKKMIDAKITMLRANAAEHLTTFQTASLEIKNLRRIAASMTYQESFVAAVDTFSKGKLAKVIRMLEQVLDPEVVVDLEDLLLVRGQLALRLTDRHVIPGISCYVVTPQNGYHTLN